MNIEQTATSIANMNIRGAGKIARAAVIALSDFAGNYNGIDKNSFLTDLEKAKKVLLNSRPTAVSLWNGIHATVKGVENQKDIGDMISLIQDNATKFIKNSENAVRLIGEIGANMINDGDVIMTHCNSSTAIEVITTAFKQGKDIKVYATESRPWRQGILTVNDLVKKGIDTTLIVDSAVASVMKNVNEIFVGADTVTSYGDLINKVGTLQLAIISNEFKVRFYACTETYKFSPMTLFGKKVTIEERNISEIIMKGEIPDSAKVFNPVFDSTPARYIDAIITESGVMSPGSVYGMIAKQIEDKTLQKMN